MKLSNPACVNLNSTVPNKFSNAEITMSVSGRGLPSLCMNRMALSRICVSQDLCSRFGHLSLVWGKFDQQYLPKSQHIFEIAVHL